MRSSKSSCLISIVETEARLEDAGAQIVLGQHYAGLQHEVCLKLIRLRRQFFDREKCKVFPSYQLQRRTECQRDNFNITVLTIVGAIEE